VPKTFAAEQNLFVPYNVVKDNLEFSHFYFWIPVNRHQISARRLRSFFIVFFLALVLLLKGCPDIMCGTIANFSTLARFTQPLPACCVGKVALYTTPVLGNIRTHLSLRELKQNNNEKNYAIYGTASNVIKVA